MNKNLPLIIWNVVLTAGLGWMLLRGGKAPDAEQPLPDTVADEGDSGVVKDMPMDTAALKDAHIAFFFMDSVQQRFELVSESADRVANEGRRLEGNLMAEVKRAKEEYNALMSKDHTYSTQTELAADEQRLRELEMRIQQSQAEGQDQIDRLQMKMLQQITERIQDFLEEYNRTAGFDYIFSIQDGGQIWVGNKGLDVTQAVVNGLNERHRAEKAAAAPKKP